MSTPASSEGPGALGRRLADIGAELRHWRPFWSAHAFREPVLPWEAEHPGLASALRSIARDGIGSTSDAQARADALLGRWFPVRLWRDLVEVPAARSGTLREWPRRMAREVPGRKWAQVGAFLTALRDRRPGRVVDWCSGKAHLGRALAVQWEGADVLALERDSALVRAARELACRDRLAVRAECCDVLAEGVSAFIDPDTRLCALHACGPLHRRLLDVAVECDVIGVACAPCCFHLGAEGHVPRSVAGRAASPGMSPPDLRTAVQEVVTAGGHARRRRERLQSWQLGFDALLREARGLDTYTPVPTATAAGRARDFTSFCRRASGDLGLELPGQIDFCVWEQRGEQRFREVAVLDCVRQQFRRLLEVWLVADLAASLEDAGYSVWLERFCEPQISPRNLLVQAVRAA